MCQMFCDEMKMEQEAQRVQTLTASVTGRRNELMFSSRDTLISLCDHLFIFYMSVSSLSVDLNGVQTTCCTTHTLPLSSSASTTDLQAENIQQSSELVNDTIFINHSVIFILFCYNNNRYSALMMS